MAAAPTGQGGARVVVADDADQIRMLLTRGIGRSPLLTVVGEARDFPSAVEVCEATRPDIAVIDRAMPGGRPAEVVALLRARFPATAIVLFSGTPVEHVEPDLLRVVDACVHKAAPLRDTVAALEALAGEHRRRLAS